MFRFLSLLFVGSVLAGPASVPSQTSAFFDFTTAYPPAPTVLSNPTCAANCTWTADAVHQYSWWKVPVGTETITRGVAYVIVNNRTNTTRTSTSYYSNLPSQHALPHTNSAGTQIQEITVSQPVDGTWKTFATNITYPSQYTQYPSGYNWWGVLPTTTADSPQSVCSWAPPYYSASLWTWPDSASATSTRLETFYKLTGYGAFVSYTQYVPYGEATANPEDPRGYSYTYVQGGHSASVPPDITDGAFQQCTFGGSIRSPDQSLFDDVAAQETYVRASYLIDTSTITEDTPASNSAKPSTTSDFIKGLAGALAATTTQSAAPAKQTSGQAVSSNSAPAAAVTAGGIKISQGASSDLVADGQTLVPGSSVIVGSGKSTTAVVLETSGGATRLAVGGSQTVDVPPPTLAVTQVPNVAPPPTTFAGATVSQNEKSEVVLDGQTLTPGSAVTIGSGSSATVVEIKTSKGVTQLVADGTTAVLPAASATAKGVVSPDAIITVGGQTFSVNSASQLVAAGQTLSKGASITLGTGASTTVVALQTGLNGHTQLIVGDTTTNLVRPTSSLFATTAGGATISLNSQADLVINGKTLKPGSTVTIGTGLAHTTIALQTSSGMTALVVNGQTTRLGNDTAPASTSSSSSSTGLGAAIIGGLAGPDSPTTTRGAAVSTPSPSHAAAPAIASWSTSTLLYLMGTLGLLRLL